MFLPKAAESMPPAPQRRAIRKGNMMQTTSLRLIAASLVLSIAAGAHASSDDAWKAFATDVEAKCRKASAKMIETPSIAVDPFGSEHYGMALLTGKPKGGKTPVSYICVYDKTTQKAEIGGELPAPSAGKTKK
jgi:hypothetical protein